MDIKYNINKTYDHDYYVLRIIIEGSLLLLFIGVFIFFMLYEKRFDIVAFILDLIFLGATAYHSYELINMQRIKNKLIWITTTDYQMHKVPLQRYKQNFIYISLLYDGRRYESYQHLRTIWFVEKENKEIKVGLYNKRAYVMHDFK